jgi:hypothetical protein
VINEDLEEFEFPQSMVVCLVDFFTDKFQADEPFVVVDRPLRPMDENGAIGVYSADCTPVPGSEEMMAPYYVGPTLNRYAFRIQNLGKGDQRTAGRRYAKDAKRIRRMLASDQDLQLRLRELTEVSEFTTERVQRMGYTKQRFLNNEFRGTFIYLAVTEFWIETETSPV